MAKSQYTHDVVATIGTYKDRQTGEDKKQYLTVGKGFTDDQGRISLKLSALPVGPDWSGWLSLYPAERRNAQDAPQQHQASNPPRDRATPAQAASAAQAMHDDDDIPF